MKVYSYSQARQRLSELLDIAKKEEVLIYRKGGDSFSVRLKRKKSSPFDVPAVKTKATTQDILLAVRESRSRKGDSISDYNETKDDLKKP